MLHQGCAQPVDCPYPVVNHVEAVGGQQAKPYGDLVGREDREQVGTHARLIGDDSGILRIGLAIAPIRRSGVVHDPSGNVEELLPVRLQQRDQQRSSPIGEVRGPRDFTAVGNSQDRGNQIQQVTFLVRHLGRQDDDPCTVDQHAVVSALASINSGP